MRNFLFLSLLFAFFVLVRGEEIGYKEFRLWPSDFKPEFQSQYSFTSQFFRLGDSILYSWNSRLCEYTLQQALSDQPDSSTHVFDRDFSPRWAFNPLFAEDGRVAFFYDKTHTDGSLGTLYKISLLQEGEVRNSTTLYGNNVKLEPFWDREGSFSLLATLSGAKGSHFCFSMDESVYFVDRQGLQRMDMQGSLENLNVSPGHGSLVGVNKKKRVLIGYGPSLGPAHIHDNCLWAYDIEEEQFSVIHIFPNFQRDTLHPITHLLEDETGQEEFVFSGYDFPNSRWLVYRSDGSQDGTFVIAEMCMDSISPYKCLGTFLDDSGTSGSSREKLVVRGSRTQDNERTSVYYLLADSTLYASSVTGQGGVEVRKFSSATGVFRNVALLQETGEKRTILVYSAVHKERGRELWRCDGNVAFLIGDLVDGPADSRAQVLGSLGTSVLVASLGVDSEASLWISDGTNMGTWVISELNISPDRIRVVRVSASQLLVPTGSLVNLRPLLVNNKGETTNMKGLSVPDHIRASQPPVYTELEGAWIHAEGEQNTALYVYASFNFGSYMLESGSVPSAIVMEFLKVGDKSDS
jgi:ELWxxDGT repeat protein